MCPSGTTHALQMNCTTAVLLKHYCSRYGTRTRVGRMKICNPNLLDEPAMRESDGFRTHDHQNHNLALYLLSYRLHITAQGSLLVEVEGLEPKDSRTTASSCCRMKTPQCCGASWNRTTFSGFSVLRIHQVCQNSNFVLSGGFEPPCQAS